MSKQLYYPYLYRELPPFDNAIWFFGCSFVYGYALQLEETAPYKLQKLINIPVANLGVTAGNNQVIKQNLQYLLENFVPKAVVIAWPQNTRWLSPDGSLWGPWLLEKDSPFCPVTFKKEYENLLFSGKLEKMNIMLVDEIREMISKYPFIEFTYCNEEGPVLLIDAAKNDPHPGPLSQSLVAAFVAKELKNKGVY